MKILNITKLLMLLCLTVTTITLNAQKTAYDFTVMDINGKKVNLSTYKGKTLLIVNVATKCGLTPQYADLQAFYEKYKDKGLVVLGFPSNDFMGQEPGSNAQISKFCKDEYKVSFPMFSKITVKGENTHPLYSFLTHKKENGYADAPVKWNFQKFLINSEGKLVEVILPRENVKDSEVEKRIVKYLK